jgi:hypothetical protein
MVSEQIGELGVVLGRVSDRIGARAARIEHDRAASRGQGGIAMAHERIADVDRPPGGLGVKQRHAQRAALDPGDGWARGRLREPQAG